MTFKEYEIANKIRELAKNGTTSITKIAEAMEANRQLVHEYIQRLVKKGIVAEYPPNAFNAIQLTENAGALIKSADKKYKKFL